MKKIIIFLIILLVTGCTNETVKTDAIKFKEEYEALNGVVKNNKEYLKLEIDEENPFIYIDTKEVIKKLQQDSSIIYFGFPECPWCRNSVPVLIDAAKELGIEKIYYNNALEIRDEKELVNGEILTKKEGTKEYKEILKLLGDYASIYNGLNDETIKRLYFPTVVFVKDGKIIGAHIATVSNQKDPYKKLNKKQYQELKSIYLKSINDVFEIVCDDAC